MAKYHLMTGRYIPHFGLNSLIFILTFGEVFSYFATSWKWYCLTFWIGKKSRLSRRFFQYSVICQSCEYIRLALTGFNKNRIFYRNCMWLQLSQIKKKNSLKEREKIHCQFCFLYPYWRHKNRKTLMFSFECAQITWAFILCACAIVKL